VGGYEKIEHDFIERTLTILDQYHELVIGHVDQVHEYEVTLLLNCLLGLLIYPQQIAHQNRKDSWLSKDYVINHGHAWGIKPEYVKRAGYKSGNKESELISLEQLTLRNLLRQMRNTAAHASFSANGRDLDDGRLEEVVFQSHERTDDFHLVMPVASLERFVRKLAEESLKVF
jgi:hypothetical protein